MSLAHTVMTAAMLILAAGVVHAEVQARGPDDQSGVLMDHPMLRSVQYVAPAPGYPPGQYYAPGKGYPGNYAPLPPPPQYYAPQYYERRFYAPPVYIQPQRDRYFCARYPWRCE